MATREVPGRYAADRERESWGRTAPVLFLVLFALVVHLPPQMDGLYGEPDTARLVNDALLWTRAGVRDSAFSQYRYFTSAGYIWLVTQLLPVARWLGVPIAAVLNALNLAI